MRAIAALAVVASVVAFAVAQVAGAASTPKLIGVVGKNGAFTITLENTRRQGRQNAPGRYVHDRRPRLLEAPQLRARARAHGSSRELTDVDFVGTKTAPGEAHARRATRCTASRTSESMVQHFTVR